MKQEEAEIEGEELPFLDPVIELYKRDVDRSLIVQNLQLSVQQRFEQLMQLQKFAQELRAAGKRQSRCD